MIRIGKPFTKTEDGRAYLCVPVDISDDTATRYDEDEGGNTVTHDRKK